MWKTYRRKEIWITRDTRYTARLYTYVHIGAAAVGWPGAGFVR